MQGTTARGQGARDPQAAGARWWHGCGGHGRRRPRSHRRSRTTEMRQLVAQASKLREEWSACARWRRGTATG
eukprot:9317906-Lingulodinium_polyedra.AAC.1